MSVQSPSNETPLSDLDQTENLSEKNSKDSASNVQPSFGWTKYAEQLNGRFAMVGFVALLFLELFSGQDFFTWLGLR